MYIVKKKEKKKKVKQEAFKNIWIIFIKNKNNNWMLTYIFICQRKTYIYIFSLISYLKFEFCEYMKHN
jgi:hypothetical protein